MSDPEKVLPNYSHWAIMDFWRLDEAVCLLLDIDPKNKDAQLRSSKELENKFDELLTVALRAEGNSLIVSSKTLTRHVNWGDGVVYARVTPDTIKKWGKSKGYELPELLLRLLDGKEKQQSITGLANVETNQSKKKAKEVKSKIVQRVGKIVCTVNEDFSNPMNIPYGGKKQTCNKLLEQNSNLFTTVAVFNTAWKAATRDKLVQVENAEQYRTGK